MSNYKAINSEEIINSIKVVSSIEAEGNEIGTYKAAVKVHQGMKILVNDKGLERLKNEPFVLENFTLNIRKQGNLWSVYFDERGEVSYQYFDL